MKTEKELQLDAINVTIFRTNHNLRKTEGYVKCAFILE